MQFEMGPPMSTYLLAVTVGRLEGVTQQSASGMNVTMWTVPGLQGQLGVALQVRVLACAKGSALGFWASFWLTQEVRYSVRASALCRA